MDTKEAVREFCPCFLLHFHSCHLSKIVYEIIKVFAGMTIRVVWPSAVNAIQEIHVGVLTIPQELFADFVSSEGKTIFKKHGFEVR